MTFLIRFNSSVGILVVRTRREMHERMSDAEFQFLGRNSGRSDPFPGGAADYTVGVSIPRSEFWSFGREIAKEEV